MSDRIQYDPMVALQIRLATVEAENHLIKSQLAQALTGSAYMLDLMGSQQHLQNIKNETQDQSAQLEHENKRLRNNLNAGLKEEARILRAKLDSAVQCNERLTDRIAAFKEDSQILRAKLDSALQCNERLTDRLDAARRAAEVAQAQKERVRPESPVWFGSWAGSEKLVDESQVGNDAATRKSVGAWIANSHWPSAAEDCKRDQPVDWLARSERSIGSNDAEVQSQSHLSKESVKAPSEKSIRPWKSVESMHAAKQAAAAIAKLPINDEQETKASKPVADGVLRIEASNGETFYIHTPSSSPMQALTSTEEANKHPLGREARSLQSTFKDNEHNRLAGAAVWIEDYSEHEYASYWVEYAARHHDHSAGEWRQYYESKIRPTYIEKMAARNNNGSSNDQKVFRVVDQRKDSAFAGVPENEAKPLIDLMMEIEDEEVRSAAEQKTTTKDPMVRYNTSQLRECRAFARSIKKGGKRFAPAPERVDFTELFGVSDDEDEAREVSIRSFTASDVREIDLGLKSIDAVIDEKSQ